MKHSSYKRVNYSPKYNFIQGCLYISDELIVLSTCTSNTLRGVVIHPNNEYSVGHHSEYWNSLQFTKFSGEVTLED
jgi:hypothetical protein